MTTADSTPIPTPSSAGSPWRLVTTLGGAGALAGFLIVFVFGWTQPTIQAYKAKVLAAAIQEVLAEPDRYDTLYVYDGALVATAPEGVDAAALEQVYLGYGTDGRPVGFAVVAAKPGFQDIVRLIFGYDPRTARIIGMKVLENKETPGLGDKIEKDESFVSEFAGVATPLTGVKGVRKDDPTAPGEIDIITGATISSRTVIRAINEVLERLGPMLAAHLTANRQ